MSSRELGRVEVMGRVESGDLKLSDAAVMLELSYRQAKRLWRRYGQVGSEGLKHGNAGQPSNRSKPQKLRRRVLHFIRKKYSGSEEERFGPTLAAEHLAEEDGIEIDHDTVRRWMLEEGLWSRQRQRKRHCQRRERKSHFGELVQVDGSLHNWFERRGPRGCLMDMVDDATSTVEARMGKEETIWEAAGVLQGWIRNYVVPRALYTDWKNVYKRKATPAEQLRGEVPVTEFGRITPRTQKITSNLNARLGLSGGPGIADDTLSNLDVCVLRLNLYVICLAPVPLNGRNASIDPESCFSAVRHFPKRFNGSRRHVPCLPVRRIAISSRLSA